jgi:hypothetical protein
MRQFKFRGKPLPLENPDDEWEVEKRKELFDGAPEGSWDGSFVYGSLVFDGIGDPYIVGEFIDVNDEYTALHYWIPVIPETVGEFTGLPCINQSEVYEGDILIDDGDYFLVLFTEGKFVALMINEDEHIELELSEIVEDSEVVGNRHDNPELLNV